MTPHILMANRWWLSYQPIFGQFPDKIFVFDMQTHLVFLHWLTELFATISAEERTIGSNLAPLCIYPNPSLKNIKRTELSSYQMSRTSTQSWTWDMRLRLSVMITLHSIYMIRLVIADNHSWMTCLLLLS